MAETTVLILGGTALARLLAEQVANMGLNTIYSLAGRTEATPLPNVEHRVGGFGGPEALADYLTEKNIIAVIDATHAYATQISQHVQAACLEKDVALLSLQDLPWLDDHDTPWVSVASIADARDYAASSAKRVFVTTGRQSVGQFTDDDRCWWLVRVVPTATATPLPDLANGTYVYERGPFGMSDEVNLMREHNIDAIISKNAGTEATYGKILAAEKLSIPIIMIERPSTPGNVLQVNTVSGAVNWLKHHS
jgi:precorrin-6A/cobalt-precorrin-6A reductase